MQTHGERRTDTLCLVVKTKLTVQTTNLLLNQLPKRELKQILSKTERVELVYNTDVYLAGDKIEHVYFPESGIISLLAAVGKASTIEVGIVGDEGMVGLSVFLGVETSLNRAVIQGAGFALKMTAADFLSECESSKEFSRILRRFTHSLMTQIAQSAACNRYHPIDARLARWLLMTRDRMKSDEFQITQEFLSNMLGVRREAVNKAASGFSNEGLISYVRGSLIINKSTELERRTCLCYQIVVDDLATAT